MNALVSEWTFARLIIDLSECKSGKAKSSQIQLSDQTWNQPFKLQRIEKLSIHILQSQLCHKFKKKAESLLSIVQKKFN